MIEIQPNEVCPFSDNCTHHDSKNICRGTMKRSKVFRCNFANNEGEISTGEKRTYLDETGRMTFLQE